MARYSPDTFRTSSVSVITAFALLAVTAGNVRAQTTPPATRPSAATVAAAAAEDIRAANEGPTVADMVKAAMPPSIHAKKMFDIVLKVSEYQGPPVQLFACDLADNACATTIAADAAAVPGVSQRIPVIFYSPYFMSKMSFTTGNEYVCLGILAHELGHIARGHVVPGARGNVKHPWMQELEADEFAGMVLAKLGAKPDELETAYRVFVVDSWFKIRTVKGEVMVEVADKSMRVGKLISGSETHPDAARRIQAIARGWKAGGGQGDVEQQLNSIFVTLVRQATRWEPGT